MNQMQTLTGAVLFSKCQRLGPVLEAVLPKLSIKTVDHVTGGMPAAAKVSSGQMDGAVEVSLKVTAFCKDVMSEFNISPTEKTELTLRASILGDDGEVERPVEVNMQGLLHEVDFGTFKTGDQQEHQFKVYCDRYELLYDNEEVVKLDLRALEFSVAGQDRLAERRANLGIG